MKSIAVLLLTLIAVTAGLAADDAEPAPTFANLSYGPHAINVLDFWKAEGEGPRPLLVYIHGGGWVGGDKKQPAERYVSYLEKGVSYAAVNYRLTGEFPLPTRSMTRRGPFS